MNRIIRKIVLPIILASFILGCETKQQVNYLNETPEELAARMQWWKDARFGMFIHWGAYAVPAGFYKGEEVEGIAEWIMDRGNIPINEYEEYVKQFNPVKFNAKEWVSIAKNAGMKYIVITSKHHDGFCLWDSKVSDYDIMDASPYGKDILKGLADECKNAGIKLCFYHSIMDWHHPDADSVNWVKYREDYLKPQLKELLTNYGDVGVLWFDGEWISEWTEPQGKDLYNYLRNINPDLIINNRVDKGRKGYQGMNKEGNYAGDFGTPEQEILESGTSLAWESCMTMNDTWGYKKNDHNWKSGTTLIHGLIDIAAKGGNFLLNVGPTAEGIIPAPSVERLREMGKWLNVNMEAIYKTKRIAELKSGENIKYVQSANEDYTYAMLLSWQEGKNIHLENIHAIEGSEIVMLGYEKPLAWSVENNTLNIEIPKELQDETKRPCQHAWVLKMKVK